MPKPLTIDEIRNFLIKNNFDLLSSSYQNCATPLHISCDRGHVQVTNYEKIRKKIFCRECFTEDRLQKAHLVAKRNNGECLTHEYENNQSNFTWKCFQGHVWESKYSNVVNSGSWCPFCSSGIYERFCRESLEFIFQEKFPKKRPNWLKNENNNTLELDGFSEKLSIAFEHNGAYHYKDIGYFNKSRNLSQIKVDDHIKQKTCKLKKIKLIIIPEIFTILPLKGFKNHLMKEFKRLKINPPKNFNKYDVNKVNIKSCKIQELQKIAKEKGGFLLSDVYLGSQTKLTWKCNEGHIWEATAAQVKHETWCPKCSLKERAKKKTKNNQGKVLAKAKKEKGNIISFDGETVNSNVLIECSEGHQWTTKMANIIYSDSWCPFCARKKD